MMRTTMRRMRNLMIFIMAYMSALVPRRAVSVRPKRILVVAAGKLGDVVCTTPVLRAIRTHLPDAKILVRENGGVNESLLADSGLVDEFLDAEGIFDYAAALRRARVDTVIITGPSLRDVAAALIARVPRVIVPRVTGGSCPQQVRPYLALLPFVETYEYAMEAYAPRERLRALEPLGIVTDDTKKQLGFSDAARAARAAFLRENGLFEGAYAIISPGAGNKIKQWPSERFARVAEHVAKRMPVIIIGSARDQDEVAAMVRALVDRARIIDASEKFSLDELKAVIAGAALFVSVDTGPLYIAEAFDVPTVDIVGPVDERVQPPRGPRHVVVVPDRKEPQLSIMNSRVYDEVEAYRQALASSVEDVVKGIDSVISNGK